MHRKEVVETERKGGVKRWDVGKLGLVPQVTFAQTIASHQCVSSATTNDEASFTSNATATATPGGSITDKLSLYGVNSNGQRQ